MKSFEDKLTSTWKVNTTMYAAASLSIQSDASSSYLAVTVTNSSGTVTVMSPSGTVAAGYQAQLVFEAKLSASSSLTSTTVIAKIYAEDTLLLNVSKCIYAFIPSIDPRKFAF